MTIMNNDTHGNKDLKINRIRSFNRFYTHKIGLMANRFLKSNYSLVQARVLFELAQGAPLCAADLSKTFDLSADYVSKLLARFSTLGLVSRTPLPGDARKQQVALTEKGNQAYLTLKKRSNQWIGEMIREIQPEETDALISAMETIEQILSPERKKSALVTLRSHRAGDIGYVIHRHGVLYAREYGFTPEFDAYVARGMAGFIEKTSPRDHLWIAEANGHFAGSIAIVGQGDKIAQLRWLIVEPDHRKKGIGKQLIAQAIRFARENDYESVILWTVEFLTPARRLYADTGFRLTETKESRVWGKILTEECWTLPLV